MSQATVENLLEENAALKEQVGRLERDNRIFQTIMNTIADGFLAVGRDGTIHDINTAYCNYFGVKRQDVLGTPIRRLIPNTKMIEIMDKNLTELDAVHVFKKGLTASGERKVAVSRMPVAFENGEIFASVALVKFSGYTNKLVQSLQEMSAEIEYYRKELSRHTISQYSFASLPTCSEVYRQAKQLAERFAKTDLPVLIQGETGVGKEVFANAIHNASPRRDGPFICINCATIPTELLESELFGYEEGAFSGSKHGGKRGKFELADRGTLLLDEIGDMPTSLQAKLLRVLQNNLIEKIGGEGSIQVDVRILAATNHNLQKKIESGTFREDLYYRLNVLPVTVPALRDRKEDIPSLVYTFLDELNQQYSRRMTISPDTLASLQGYNWPGNIRELKNVIGRSFVTADGAQIQPGNLPPYLLIALDQDSGSEALNAHLLQQERDIILSALRRHRCNCAKAAKALGIHRATLYTKMEKYSICIQELRGTQDMDAGRKITSPVSP
ncbi:MAG: sigma 54-interacting transcriptional regulator [Desulfovibrio sp.]|jgi:PAS domain S-box-containing protein|nr:sigma 54-interacting transcriptional regulator [Desulfovibrio sp.]